MAYYPKNFGSPIKTYTNPVNEDAIVDYYNRAVNHSADTYKSFLSDKYIRPEVINAQNEALKKQEYNTQLNSLRLLTNKAYNFGFEDSDYANKLATDLFNRIQTASDQNQLNELYKELEDLKEKAGSSTGIELINTDSSLLNFGNQVIGTAANLVSDIFNPTRRLLLNSWNSELKLKNKAYKDLQSDYNVLDDQSKRGLDFQFDVNDLFDFATRPINQKRFSNEANNLSNTDPEFFKKLDKSLTDVNNPNALNYLLKDKFINKTSTRGDEFFREDDEEKNNIYNSGIRAIDDPSRDLEKSFKYDLEKNTLKTIQVATINKIKQLNQLPEEELTAEQKQEKKSLLNTLNKIETRSSNLSKIYGMSDSVWDDDTTDKSGMIRALLSTGVIPFANIISGRTEFEKILKNTQVYQPTVLKYDKSGNPVMSTQFTYVKQNGDIGYNWGSIPELGGSMVGIILPTLALSSFTGGVVSGISGSGLKTAEAATRLQSGYNALNRYKGLKLADRLATLTSVTATTIPMMVEEEKRWGGNYMSRGIGKALVEGITEAVGFPDVGALRAKPFLLDLGTASKKIASSTIGGSERLAIGLSAAGQFGREALKQNAVEAFEEELSLLGNALLEHTMFDKSMFDAGRERTTVNSENMIDTYVDSFLGGLVYSGGTNILSARKTLSKDNLYNAANWQAVNNQELFKAKLLDQKDSGKITNEEFVQGLSRLNELNTIFKSNIASISKMKDLRTLLDDKDKQYELFTTAVRQNDLIGLNFNELSEEDLKELGDVKLQRMLGEKGQKKLVSLREEIAVLSEKENKTEKEEEDLVKKTTEYAVLRRANTGIVNRKDLSKQQLDVLADLGIIPNVELEYTLEDFEKEVNSITKDILKLKKQEVMYDNLTEADKNKIIEDLFTKRIEALKESENPNEIVESMENLKKDLEYLKLKEKGNEFDIAQRERLYDAYGKRFGELVERGENNLNQVEQKFETPGYYSKFNNSNNIFDLLSDLEFLEENKDYIDENLYKTIQENLMNYFEQNLNRLRSEEITPQERINILTDFYDKIASKSPLTLYNLDKTNNFFSILKTVTKSDGEKVEETVSPEFTQEEMETARENVIQKRAKKYSSNIANGKKPYVEDEVTEEEDLTPTEDTTLSEEEKEDVNNDLDQIFSNVQTKEDEDSSKNDQGDETVIPKYLEDAKFFYEKNKDKSPEKLAEVARNIARRSFNYNKNPQSEYSTLVNAGDRFFKGEITFEEYQEVISAMKNKYPSKVEALAVHEVFVGLAYNSGKIQYTGKDNAGSASTAPVLSDTKTQTKPTQDPSIEKRDQELDTITQIKVTQLLNLASPLRTVGVELDRNNEPSTDPADIRRVKHLKEASSEDFPTKVKVGLVNRQKFMQMYLEKKYPNKSAEEIQNDLNIINEFFENSEENTPLPDNIIKLLGDTFFSTVNRPGGKSQVNYWQSSKGKGFSQSPDVVTTFINEDGSLYLFNDGFPLDLNTTTVSEERASKTIPWNVSHQRIINQLTEEGITEKQILDAHLQTHNNFEKLKGEISADNNKVVTADYRISEGVFITAPMFELGTALQQNNNSAVSNTTIESFALVTNKNQRVFNKTNNFELGRVYYNVNGNPVKLSNSQISKEEAEALADLIFTNEFPEAFDGVFDEMQEFRDYLFNLINDSSKNNRIYFKPNREYEKGTNPEAFHTNVLYKEGKTLKQLNKEQFVELVQKFYYKASKDYIKANKSIPRFEKEGDNIRVLRQSYSEYLMSTHSFPVDKDGKVLNNVNQLIYFNIPEINQSKPITTKTVVTVKQTPKQADSSKNLDPEGFEIVSTQSPYIVNKDKYTIQAYIPSRQNLIKKLKEIGKGENTLNFFSNMTDAEYSKFVSDLASVDSFKHLMVRDSNSKTVIVDEVIGRSTVYNVKPGDSIIIEVDGVKLLIPTTTKEEASFNLRYQPSFSIVNLALSAEKVDATTVGINSNTAQPNTTVTVTQDAKGNVKVQEEEEDDFGDDDFEDADQQFVQDPSALEGFEQYEGTDQAEDTDEFEEPTALEQPTQPVVEVKPAKKKGASRLNNMISNQDQTLDEEATDAKKFCDSKSEIIGTQQPKKKPNPFKRK